MSDSKLPNERSVIPPAASSTMLASCTIKTGYPDYSCEPERAAAAHFSHLFIRSLKFGIFSDNTTRSYEIDTERLNLSLIHI